jgi:streptogramin lyase
MAAAIAVLLTVTAAPSLAGASAGTAPVTTKQFHGAFQPDQVVGAAGAIWLVGAGPGGDDYGAGCRLGRLNPESMRVTTYRIPECGFNVTAGDGSIFLETWVVSSDQYQIHIERFSTAAHTATVFPTVSAALCVCSAIAHTQLAYADGSLWFYVVPDSSNGPEVLQLSPASGVVEHVYLSVPQIGGTEPFIAGTPGYVWLAGGPGSGPDFARIDVATDAVLAVQPPGPLASVYEVIAVGDQLYFLYLSSNGDAGAANSYTSHLGHLGPNGVLVAESPSEQVGGWLAALAGRLYSAGVGSTCSSGAHAWSIDETTLRATRVANLAPSGGNPCLGADDFRPVAVADGALFYLDSNSTESVLYRVAAS